MVLSLNCRERDRAQTDKKSNEKPNFLIRNKLIQITQGGTFQLPTGTGYLESWVYHVVQSVINVNISVIKCYKCYISVIKCYKCYNIDLTC